MNLTEIRWAFKMHVICLPCFSFYRGTLHILKKTILIFPPYSLLRVSYSAQIFFVKEIVGGKSFFSLLPPFSLGLEVETVFKVFRICSKLGSHTWTETLSYIIVTAEMNHFCCWENPILTLQTSSSLCHVFCFSQERKGEHKVPFYTPLNAPGKYKKCEKRGQENGKNTIFWQTLGIVWQGNENGEVLW